jgi:hypothetical protein
MGPFEPGTRIGDYRVESLIRSGVGGASYRAEQPGLGRSVLLYVADAPPRSDAAARFVRSAQALARIDDPRVLPVYEVGERDGRVFAALRDMPGRRLDDRLGDGPMAAPDAVVVTGQLSSAVEALEEADLDLATVGPADVVLADDGAYLSPVHLPLDRGGSRAGESSVAALARLLATMLTAQPRPLADRLPEALRPIVVDAARYASPREFAAAASAAVAARAPRPGRRKRPTAVAAAGVLAAGIVIAAVLVAGAREPRPEAARSPVDAPAGRVAAAIALGGDPISLAEGDGALWVALSDGTVTRVDPRSNQVVGAPIRFGRPDKDANITVRAGAGAVFALDSKSGTVARIDPRRGRVTRRVRLTGDAQTAAVAGGALWVTRERPGSEILRLDARTLRRVGRSYPVGLAPVDIEAARGAVWVMSIGDGKVTRVRPGRGEVRSIVPTGAAANATLHGDALWVPNPLDGLITRVDATTLQPGASVLRLGHPFATTSTADSVWAVAGLRLANPGESPGRLYRIDPRTGRLSGRPVDVGRPIGQPVSSAGAVWINDAARRSLLKVIPTTPAPRLQAPPRASNRLRAGPLRHGRWDGDRFTAPFTIAIAEPGWINLAYERQRHAFGRLDTGRGLELLAPTDLITTDGGVTPLRTPSQVVRWLVDQPQLRVSPSRRTRLGGRPATVVDVTVDTGRVRDFPPFCRRPCVLSFSGSEGNTAWFEARRPTRVYVLADHRPAIVVLEDLRSRAHTAPLVRSLRFR